MGERRATMPESLSYEGFRSVILSQMEKRFDGDSDISEVYIRETVKNNDKVRDTLIVHSERNRCMPCLHIDDLYNMYETENVSIDSMVDSISEFFYSYSQGQQAVPGGLKDMILDFDCMGSLIECRLVNGETNRHRLKGMPHKRIGEFALTYQARTGEARHGYYMMQIDERLMKEWGVDEEELHETAVRNMDLEHNFVFRHMDELMGMSLGSNMFVLTSRSKINGATVIISEEVRRKVSSYMGGDYYILPSSIHELIIIATDRAPSPECLADMVREVNRTKYVSPEEFLSDNVYEYIAEMDVIVKAGGEADALLM